MSSAGRPRFVDLLILFLCQSQDLSNQTPSCGIGLESRNQHCLLPFPIYSSSNLSAICKQSAMAVEAEHGEVLKWEYCVTYQDDLNALSFGSFYARHWRECNHLQNNSFSAVYWRTRASRDTSPCKCYPAIFKISGYKNTKYNLVEVLSLLSSF